MVTTGGSYLDFCVATMVRTQLRIGLFENRVPPNLTGHHPFPYQNGHGVFKSPVSIASSSAWGLLQSHINDGPISGTETGGTIPYYISHIWGLYPLT